jgi:hypothetical protein
MCYYLQLPIFSKEPDGTNRIKNKYIMGRRNWCAVSYVPQAHELEFDIRVEKEKGAGTSVG